MNAISGRTERPRILYLWLVDDNPVQEAKLAGIRRYAASRRWDVVAVHESKAGPGSVEALLAEWHPLGCIVESAGGKHFLPPRRFGAVPVVYLDMPPGLHGNLADRSVAVDDEAVAGAAFRELSVGLPKALAVVQYREPVSWSRRRSKEFRSLAAAAKVRCRTFALQRGEDAAARASRLAAWLAALPRPCGVFAVNDETGAEVAAAVRASGLRVPHDIAFVGVDDSVRYSGESDPPFTSIRLDFERAGYVAARMLGEQGSHRVPGKPGAQAVSASRHGNGGDAVSFGPLLAVRRKSTGGRGRHEKFVLEAVEIIRREACNGLTAAELVSRFRGSRRLFELRFREATGHSVLDEILHVRLEKVQTLLARTETAVEAIPALCGFRGNRALERLFRSRFGMSMLLWRRRRR